MNWQSNKYRKTKPKSPECLAWSFMMSCSCNTLICASGYILKKRIITRDVPNSVVFTYDAHLSPTDSMFFQQSWDTSRRTQIDKTVSNILQFTIVRVFTWPN